MNRPCSNSWAVKSAPSRRFQNMRTTVFRATCLLACLAFATFALSQAMNEGQGHPLKGVWLGDWGTDQNNRNPVIIEMNWDGKAITGRINPGPDAVQFSKADL